MKICIKGWLVTIWIKRVTNEVFLWELVLTAALLNVSFSHVSIFCVFEYLSHSHAYVLIFYWIMVKIQPSFKYSEFHVKYFTIFSLITTLITDVT